MTTNIIVNHIGSYDGANGHFWYFDNAAKKKAQCSKLIHDEYKEKEGERENDYDDVEDCGYVIDFEDTLIDYTLDDVFLGVNKRIPINHVTLSNESPTSVIEGVESTLFYPSKILEREHRVIIDKLRKQYVMRERDLECLFQLWQEPKCGMGLTIKTSVGKNILVNNRVGNRAFNVFNSYFLGMEIHRDFDLLMAMVSFLKYNCMWGGGHVSLKNCDYVGVFIGRESFVDDVIAEQERRTSSRPYTFLVERATLISDYSSSRARIADAVATARLINSQQLDEDDNKNDDDEYAPPKKKIKLLSSSSAAAAASSSAFKFTEKQMRTSRLKSNEFSTRCNHDVKIPLDGILPLEESSDVICLRCFLTLFFWDWDLSVTMTDYNDMISTVRHWMRTARSTSIDTKGEGLQKLANCIRMQHGAVNKRGFNWPSEAMESGLFEYSTYVLSTLLEVDRWRLSSSSSSHHYKNGDMEPGLLYHKMNTFGKTLLLLMINCTVHEYDRNFTTVIKETLDKMRNNMLPPKMETLLNRLPFNKINGRWFNVRHRGPSIWRYQIYAMKNIGNECPSLSLESRRMIPTSPEDNECCKRMLFKIHCRGSDLGKGGELVSDVCNSVSELQKLLNNKKYRLSFIDDQDGNDVAKGYSLSSRHRDCCKVQSSREGKRWMKIESAVVIGEPIVSLEVTNYRPLKCSQYKNGSLVANRLAMLLNIRSGSRIKLVRKSKSLSVVLLEDLSSSESDASAAACERVLMGSKVLYYDIETTGLNPLADNAMITSIGCTLSRGNGSVKERSIFAYGRNKKELKEKIIELYEKDIDDDNEPQLPTPNIVVAETESELLCNFTDYVNDYCGPLTAIAGWNSGSFDDPFLFISLYKCLNDYRTPISEKRKLFRGLFDFSLIMNDDEKSSQQKVDSFSPMIIDHTEGGGNSFRHAKKYTSPLEKLISCLLICPSLDMMKIMGKKFSETLPSMSLNTVLAHICSISNTNAVQKDPIDVKYHLLGYRERTTEENALVQKYCCKDAYLVTKPAERMGVLAEIIQLGKESNMNVSVVSAMYLTQLHIIEGAVLRAMGPERAFMRSCAIRPHSQYTKTLGGYVTTPLAKFQTLHAMDMGSLYPSAMRQNNLDTTTVCSHRQIIDCRNRVMIQMIKKTTTSSSSSSFLWGTPEALTAMDEANAFIMDRYRPCDLVVDSWKNNRKLIPNHCVTRLVWENCKTTTTTEQQQQQQRDDDNRAWNESNCHNCTNQVTDLGYFPEVGCNADLQLAALVNDDSHVELCSLEYMLPFLVPMMIDNPAIIAEITARLTNSLQDVVDMLEEDFTLERDQVLVKTRYSYTGNACRGSVVLAQSIESKFEEALASLFKDKTFNSHEQEKEGGEDEKTNPSLFVGQARRLMSLCVRIARRVYAYDSARDEAVAKWSNRLLNVGNRCRVWNARQWILQGTIPLLQRRYREERVVLKRQVKLKAKSEPLAAAQYKVEEGVKKLFMNSIYGVLVLRVPSQQSDSISRWKTDNSLSRLLVGHAAEGVGGGTRHAPMGNQITQISRRIFLNIGPSIRYFLPNCIQGYGDTDSVFMTHNFPREMQMVFPPPSLHRQPVIEMDLVLRERISRLLQIIVNGTTKGIRFNPELAAGEEAMIIEHERLAITTHTAGKKTYHMIHFKEDEPLYINLVKTLVSLNEAKSESEERAFLEDFYRNNPVSRIVSLHKNEENAHYVYPHNGPELCRLFTDDEKTVSLNRQSGGAIFSDGPLLPIDRRDDDRVKRSKLSKALSASKYFAAIKLEAVINALGNGFLEISGDGKEAKFVDVRTGVRLSDPDKIFDTSVALRLMKVYKKGKFTKKGISYASKLREIQTACLAWTQHQLYTYDTIVDGHAKRCLSYTEDPEDYITVSRVNKEQVPKKMGDVVTLPNPTARLINNHLNPSRVIELGEKFLTILATSGRTLINRRDATAKTLLHLPKKRWNPTTERGVLAVSSVKNLGVVCHTTHSIMELIKRDCESILKIISWCLDSLHNVARGEGFCLADNASSYNTGILVSHILTKFLLSSMGRYKFALSSNNIISYDNNNCYDDDDNNNEEDDDDTYSTRRDCDKNVTSGKLMNPLLLKINTIFSTLYKNQGQVGIPLFQNNNSNTETPEEAINLLEKIYKCHPSVFTDLNNFTKIWVRAREYKLPRHENEKTPLSRIMSENAAAGPRRVRDILKTCAAHVKKHSNNCKIRLVDDRDEVFLHNLISILGRENCLETCVSAGAAALLFNLLYCVFLHRRREKYQREFARGEESFEDVCSAEERPWAIKFYQMMKKENVIRSCFSDRYHPTTNSLVFLAEPKLWFGGDGSFKRCTLPNEMRGVSLKHISVGVGTGSSLIRNNLVGPILDASNIHPFQPPKNITNTNSSSHRGGDIFDDVLYKSSDNGYDDENDDDDEEDCIIYRPGFYHVNIVEEMFACLGALVINKK